MAHFGTLEALMGATEQELVDIEDVGEIVASSITEYSRMKKTAASSIVCWKPACIHRCTCRRMQAHCFEGLTFVTHRNAADAFSAHKHRK